MGDSSKGAMKVIIRVLNEIRSKPLGEDLVVTSYHFIYGLYNFCLSAIGHLPSRWLRNWSYRNLFLINISRRSTIYHGAHFEHAWKIKIGKGSIIGENAYLDARRCIEIGDHCAISGDLRLLTLQHDIDDPDFGAEGGEVVIGDRVYIGYRATILPGVHIGEGAVVAAGSVVTKDVQPWTVVGGVPAKFIRERAISDYHLNDAVRHPSFFK